MKIKLVMVVECEDEWDVDIIWDAASSEAYNNPDIKGLEFVSAIQVKEE